MKYNNSNYTKFFSAEKMVNLVNKLAENRYDNKKNFNSFYFLNDVKKDINPLIPKIKDMRENSMGMLWSGYDEYLFINFKVKIPSNGKNVFVVDFTETMVGMNNRFETMAYINGKAIHGVDNNHPELFIPREYNSQEVEICFRLWSNFEWGMYVQDVEFKIRSAFIATLNPLIDSFYYDVYCLNDMINTLDENNENRIKMQNLILRIYDIIDLNESSNLEKEVLLCKELYDEEINKLTKFSDINLHLIGHSHLDLAWLWRTKNTKEKAQRTFSKVLSNMEHFENYKFMQSSPQLYEWIKESYPNLFAEIKQKIGDGRWEADGAMWVEADCVVTSGESLSRQLYYGKKFFKEEFNHNSQYLWLPDVFGYTWSLPQLLKQSGIKTFMTSKISWNQYNQMPSDTFMWRGIDGSEILTYFISTPDLWVPENSFFSSYNGILNANVLIDSYKRYSDKEINSDIIVPFGYGDGGGGVNRHMLEIIQRYEKYPCMPNIRNTLPSQAFNQIHDNITHAYSKTPLWDGELYLEFHRGTYTSQALMKKYNRKLEELLIKCESYDVLCNKKYTDFSKIWKNVLLNQFHDIIPGTSIKEVYGDAFKESEFMIDKLQRHLNPKFCNKNIVNLSNFDFDGLIKVEETSNINTILGNYFYIENICKYSSIKYTNIFTEDILLPETFEFDTINYKIVFNEKAQIVSYFDKNLSKEFVHTGKNFNKFIVFEDKPMFWDAWDIDIYYQDKFDILENGHITKVKENKVSYIISTEFTYKNSKIMQDVILLKNSKQIRFDTKIDWHEKQTLLKVAFETDIRSPFATYDIQYGNIQRPTHRNTSWDLAKFEVPAHYYGDISNNSYGLAIINDCKYGYSCLGSDITLTLIKSGTYPDPNADIGIHEFSYAMYVHENALLNSDVEKVAYNFNNQPIITGNIDNFKPCFNISNHNVRVDALKFSDDRKYLVLRMHDYRNMVSKLDIKFDESVKNVYLSNILEEKLDKFETYILNEYELLTLLIEL